MIEIKMNVNFDKHECKYEKKDDMSILTSGDYNSTKVIFNFNRDDGKKVFEMKNPSGEIVFVKEIMNDEIVLTGIVDITTIVNNVIYTKYFDESDNVYWHDRELDKLYNDEFVEVDNTDINTLTKETRNASLFACSGTYPFEISLYDGDSKLTSESNCFIVQPEQVVIDNEVVDVYMPIFDELINQIENALNEINNSINEVDNIDIDVNKVDHIATIEITRKDGTTKTVQIFDGEKGDSGITLFTIENGHLIGVSESASNYENYSISNGHLYLEIGE